MIKLNYLVTGHLIYEGLIYSVSTSDFEDYVNRWAASADSFVVTNKGKKIQLNFHRNITEEELNNLIRYINTLGWYIAAYLVGEPKMNWKKFDVQKFTKDSVDKKLYSFQLEAKFDVELNKREFDWLYHSTPSVNDPKIKKIGLVPKVMGKISYHPERIYFTRTEEELAAISNQFHKRNPSINEFSHHKINVGAAIKDDSTIRLFDDPNFFNGIYTLSNIGTEFIEFIRKEKYE